MPQGFDKSTEQHTVIDVKPGTSAFHDSKLHQLGRNHIGSQFENLEGLNFNREEAAMKMPLPPAPSPAPEAPKIQGPQLSDFKFPQ